MATTALASCSRFSRPPAHACRHLLTACSFLKPASRRAAVAAMSRFQWRYSTRLLQVLNAAAAARFLRRPAAELSACLWWRLVAAAAAQPWKALEQYVVSAFIGRATGTAQRSATDLVELQLQTMADSLITNYFETCRAFCDGERHTVRCSSSRLRLRT